MDVGTPRFGFKVEVIRGLGFKVQGLGEEWMWVTTRRTHRRLADNDATRSTCAAASFSSYIPK